MTLDQKLRRTQYTILSGLIGFFLSFLVLLFTFGNTFSLMLVYVVVATISPTICVFVLWGFYCKKPESRRRGIKYGFGMGILSLFLAAMLITVLGPFLEWENIDSASDVLYYFTFTPIISLFVFFIFGGFLAPIIGAIAGYFLAKPVENSE